MSWVPVLWLALLGCGEITVAPIRVYICVVNGDTLTVVADSVRCAAVDTVTTR